MGTTTLMIFVGRVEVSEVRVAACLCRTSGRSGVQHFVQIGGLWRDSDAGKDEFLIDWKVNQACNSHVQS